MKKLLAFLLLSSPALALTPDSIIANPGDNFKIDIGLEHEVRLIVTKNSTHGLSVASVVQLLAETDIRCESAKLGRVAAVRVDSQKTEILVMDAICTGGPLFVDGKKVTGV